MLHTLNLGILAHVDAGKTKVLESSFDHYREVRGRPPTRPRTDAEPLNRRAYLLRVVRRAGATVDRGR